MLLTRRDVIQSLAALPLLQQPVTVPPRPPALSGDEVMQFVRLAHADLDATRKMLDTQPRLIRATWDWGGGDFETALGAAAHMGRRDIATFLLERGAQFDLFAAAMLGELAIVKAALEARPALARVPGPHGIPLLAHAKAGGPGAVPVLDYVGSVLTRLGSPA